MAYLIFSSLIYPWIKHGDFLPVRFLLTFTRPGNPLQMNRNKNGVALRDNIDLQNRALGLYDLHLFL